MNGILNQEASAFASFAIVISVKGRPLELAQALRGIYLQNRLPREIIVIDDCSDPPLARERLPAPPAGLVFTLVRNDINLGNAKSLNNAVRAASQPFIAVLDSDDCYLPDMIERLAQAWVTAEAQTICIAPGFFWCTNDLLPYKVQGTDATVTREELLARGNSVGGSSVFSFRRDDFVAVGGYPELRGNHDWGLLLRLSEKGRIVTLAAPLVLYRSPSTNPSPTYTKNYRGQILSLCKIYKAQPLADRPAMIACVRERVLGNLVLWGRRGLALKMMRSIIARGVTHGGRYRSLIRPVIILVIGSRGANRIFYIWAHLRAALWGRSLLARHGYAPQLIETILRLDKS